MKLRFDDVKNQSIEMDIGDGPGELPGNNVIELNGHAYVPIEKYIGIERQLLESQGSFENRRMELNKVNNELRELRDKDFHYKKIIKSMNRFIQG